MDRSREKAPALVSCPYLSLLTNMSTTAIDRQVKPIYGQLQMDTTIGTNVLIDP